ncbi:hypothetical protein HYPSUDRAFT_536588 [Hypholoma sublateritium FD-334 SS-4]|uniref:Nephrocystin 3-like N-terminal domain-containing protein n=1 Tax=Hypholoma sublateritium (strain FD-334 SS-4) TaxID=945553 RepID=A0A0D2P6F6_HYPSF|nr:hypothetical protein HYPSUDRAFT_536588 [Hypholoma sublateritium FD-334 SS-4]
MMNLEEQQCIQDRTGEVRRYQLWGSIATTIPFAAFVQLQQCVATSALHESAEFTSECICYPNTRNTLLDSIIINIDRATAPQETEKFIWINGAAGSGKTSIAHSVAERCLGRGIIVATFFFGRSDPNRNTIHSVVSTIAYQLCQQIPAAKRIILSAIAGDPLIFDKAFNAQFQMLVIDPLLRVQGKTERSRTWSILLLLDGLDECPGMEPHQIILIQTISKHLRQSHTLPLTVLITSRPESHLSMQFTGEGNFIRHVALDTSYPAHNDIRRYLNAKFDTIKTTHPLKEDITRLGKWPSTENIQKIMSKDSGQFIYAAVVMNFVSDGQSYPPDQLDIALSLESCSSSTSLSVWTALDSMYHHVFSQLKDLPQAILLVSFVILAEIVSLVAIAAFFDIPLHRIRTTLGGLSSVMNCQGNNLVLLHASLPDFLLDKARSGAYYINPTEWKTQLCVISLKKSVATPEGINL